MQEKRNISVTVKMTESDLRLLKRAATALWPDAILTTSSIVLGLARIAANEALSKKKQ